jgi:hypothetical protein
MALRRIARRCCSSLVPPPLWSLKELQLQGIDSIVTDQNVALPFTVQISLSLGEGTLSISLY